MAWGLLRAVLANNNGLPPRISNLIRDNSGVVRKSGLQKR